MGHIDGLSSFLNIRDMSVVDVGAGTGAICAQLYEAGARVTAIEVDPDKVEAARAGLPAAICVLQGRAEALPLADGSQDVVCLFFSFHHVPADAQGAALAEACRVLRPRGRLHVVEPYPHGSMFDVVRLVDDETDVRTRSHAILQRPGLAGGGFRLLDTVTYTLTRSYPHFGDFHDQIIRPDRSRRERYLANRHQIEARFEHVLDRGSSAPSLHQPCAAYHFAKVQA